MASRLSFRVSEKTRKLIARLAHRRGLTTSEVVRQAIAEWADREEWLLEEVEKGLAAANRGEFVDHEEVRKLIDRRHPG